MNLFSIAYLPPTGSVGFSILDTYAASFGKVLIMQKKELTVRRKYCLPHLEKSAYHAEKILLTARRKICLLGGETSPYRMMANSSYRAYYGNVMCSRGSVIPLFIDQIKAGNPITITNPDMTRFLMNLDEAVDLVKFAFKHAVPGDLFIQKADASTIGDLAKEFSSFLAILVLAL